MSNERRPVLGDPLAVLGSLKLTVALLGMSIFLVFVGTLAQVDRGIWTVIHQYFRCWFAWVELKIFFPRDSKVGGGFYFPGGWLLGAALLANLVVSHVSRIRVQARGGRLLLGSGVLAIGAAITWVLIVHVFDADSSEKKIDPTLRVTLQLLQGAGAAIVLFMGCWMVFRRKAGIVLLHAGIVLLMFSELATGLLAEEGTMTVYEGQEIGFVEDNRHAELAIVDPSDPSADDVVVVPESRLKEGGTIVLPGLPFNVEMAGKGFMKNATLADVERGEPNPASEGAGRQFIARERSEEKGVDTDGAVDLSAAYVTFRDTATGKNLGTYLTAVQLTRMDVEQVLPAGGKEYRVALRFKRTYKPYRLFLYDFQRKTYDGTETPKDFSSYVRLEDPERRVSRDVRIWMNNPLRYRGDTLYQSSFDGATETGTILQVVTNRGWMVPYISCMIVATGLLGQFLLHLGGFLAKRRAA